MAATQEESTMMFYLVEVELDAREARWTPQYPNDTAKTFPKVMASSPEKALEAMEILHPGRPKRIVPGF
jgi:hypothetical protein